MRHKPWAAGAAIVVLALAPGCSAGGGSTELSITVTPDEGTAPETWTLACNPTGGTHPDAEAACAFLAQQADAGADPFAPVPDDVACTQQYGGPAVATVQGTWEGAEVSASYSLTNGCEIARWTLVEPLLVYPPFAN